MNRVDAIHEVVVELTSVSEAFGEMYSPHEGIAIIQEEFEELKSEVFGGSHPARFHNLRVEAKQLAVMAIRFMIDIT